MRIWLRQVDEEESVPSSFPQQSDTTSLSPWTTQQDTIADSETCESFGPLKDKEYEQVACVRLSWIVVVEVENSH